MDYGHGYEGGIGELLYGFREVKILTFFFAHSILFSVGIVDTRH